MRAKASYTWNIFEYLGLSEPEFNDIVSKTVVPPNAPNFNKNGVNRTSIKFIEKIISRKKFEHWNWITNGKPGIYFKCNLFSQGWLWICFVSRAVWSNITFSRSGVGSYSAAMSKLTSMKLIDPINFAEDLNPIMGICLGMQILWVWNWGNAKGLGLIDGQVLTLEKSKQFPYPMLDGMKLIKDECNILEV